MKEIADEVGAKFWVDMAHFAGLVAAGLQSPVPYADVVSSTAHKTFGGPRLPVSFSPSRNTPRNSTPPCSRPAGRSAHARDCGQGP